MTAPGPAGFHVHLFSSGSPVVVGWRVLSGNNRSVGRNAVGYSSELACRAAVRDLQRSVDSLHGVVRRSSPYLWTWELSMDGQLVAVAGRGFDRLIRCEQGLAAFLKHFAEASVAAAVTDADSRRWRSASGQDSRIDPGVTTRSRAEQGDVA